METILTSDGLLERKTYKINRQTKIERLIDTYGEGKPRSLTLNPNLFVCSSKLSGDQILCGALLLIVLASYSILIKKSVIKYFGLNSVLISSE